MKQILYLCTVLLLAVAGCKKDDNNNLTPQAAHDELNVSYGSHPRQVMDLYFPEGYTSETPVVFLMHGGGLVAGSKEEFTAQARLFRDQQFIVANLSYRLVDTTGLLSNPPLRRDSDVKLRDQLNDIDAAIAAYRSKAPGWGSGAGEMYMAGHSAGAILTLLYTQGDKNRDNHIRAGGNWAGVTDITIPHDSLRNGVDPRWLELMHRAVGWEMKTANNLAYMAHSPFWQAFNEGGRPIITIYPENNELGGTGNGQLSNDYNYLRTADFHKLLTDRGVANQLAVMAGEDHGYGTKPGSWAKLVAETAAWFKAR